MIGRSLARAFPARPAAVAERRAEQGPLLTVDNLAGPGFHNISFRVRPGEILGVGGLQGHGHRELFLALFGDSPARAGRMCVDGRPVTLRSPRDAIAAGIALIPEERKTEGLLLDLSGRENVALPNLRRLTRWLGLVDWSREATAVTTLFDRLGVDRSALYRPAKAFSGGNQQKMLFAKWLLTNAKILLLYDPTRGVDVGAKYETYSMMRDLANQGAALLFYSTDVEELVHLPDRVIVLYNGEITAELSGRDLTSENVMAAIVGMNGQGSTPLLPR